MGVTTLTFWDPVEVVKDYLGVEYGGHSCKGSRDNRGQSFYFDLEYLVKYVKVKVKVKCYV